MLHRETVTSQLMDVLEVLMTSSELNDLRLVGGTALALQLGHRNSVDIDLFGSHQYSSSELDIIISKMLSPQSQKGGDTIKAYIVDGVKVDIVKYHYAWLDPQVIIQGIRMASIKDIAAMKVAAITNRGSKKDFVDLYVLLQHFSLEEIMSFYLEKIQDGNKWLAVRSITYFDDADLQPMPKLFIDVTWEDIKSTITDVAKKEAGGF